MTRIEQQPGYIYIMECTGYYKIGKASDPHRRYEVIQAANPHKVTLIKLFPTNNMSAAELFLHKKFAQNRVRGEWFWLSNVHIEWLLRVDHIDLLLTTKGRREDIGAELSPDSQQAAELFLAGLSPAEIVLQLRGIKSNEGGRYQIALNDVLELVRMGVKAAQERV